MTTRKIYLCGSQLWLALYFCCYTRHLIQYSSRKIKEVGWRRENWISWSLKHSFFNGRGVVLSVLSVQFNRNYWVRNIYKGGSRYYVQHIFRRGEKDPNKGGEYLFWNSLTRPMWEEAYKRFSPGACHTTPRKTLAEHRRAKHMKEELAGGKMQLAVGIKEMLKTNEP